MDTKMEIKKEDPVSDDEVSHSEREFFHNVVTINANEDAGLLDNDCDMAIKTEIKTEIPFTKHFVKQTKSETETCSNNWEIDRKIEIAEETLISSFSSQDAGQFLPEYKKYNSGDEMENKIEIKQEPLWLETETSLICDDNKVADFPLVKSSRLCIEAVSGASSDKSPMPSIGLPERDTSSYNGKNHLECEHQKNSITEIPTAEEQVVSEQSGKCDEGEVHIQPLYFKQKSLIHKRKRTHKCNICEKAFSCQSHLKRHNLTHENKKSHQNKMPHKCKICDKTFTLLGNLKMHNLIHEGKKPHHCKTCDKSFTQLSHLKRHNLIHEGKKPYQCKSCDKSFTHLSSLKTHNLIHEGKKLHQCKTCDKWFTRLSALKTHNLIHEGKKPHKCKTCDKTFTQLSNLKRHSLLHEGKEVPPLLNL